MESEIKSLLRTIVRKVHPDLFGSYPSEKGDQFRVTKGEENLQVLH